MDINEKIFNNIKTCIDYEYLAKPMIERAIAQGRKSDAIVLSIITEPLKKQYDALQKPFVPVFSDAVDDYIAGDKLIEKAICLLLGYWNYDYLKPEQIQNVRVYFDICNGKLRCVFNSDGADTKKIKIADRLTCVLAYSLKYAAYVKKYGNDINFKMQWESVDRAFVFCNPATKSSGKARLDNIDPPKGYNIIQSYLYNFGVQIPNYDDLIK